MSLSSSKLESIDDILMSSLHMLHKFSTRMSCKADKESTHASVSLQVSLMCTDEILPDNLNLKPITRGKREPTEEELAAAAAAQAAAAPKRGRGRPNKWKVGAVISPASLKTGDHAVAVLVS